MASQDLRAERITAAALSVCKTFDFLSDEKVNLNGLLQEALGDQSLVNLEAGVSVSLTAAFRQAIKRSPPAGVERDRRMDYAICEVLSALWKDDGYISAWQACGHSKEFANRCPLSEIVGGARFALSYGDSNAQRMYFSNFSRINTHASMMSDEVRTGTYYRAILQNRADFEGKVVMDVGSGSGILAFFCLKAGAAKVYCIEASPMEKVIHALAEANGLADRIVVINRVLQEIDDEVPEQVDVIVSETLGNCLLAERGIETVIVARERFLKPDGKLFPCKAIFVAAPFCDDARHKSRMTESLHFWTKKDFFGLDMTAILDLSRKEVFNRPLGDTFHPDQLKADPVIREFDFRTLRSEELANFSLDFKFLSKDNCVIHGLACWFEALFEGSMCDVVLSTSPWDTLTHWWQTRFMFLEPLGVNNGQEMTGNLLFTATEKNTYDCTLTMEANGVKRRQECMSLLDIDTGHRKFSYIEQAIPNKAFASSGKMIALRVPDYATTKAEPTTGKELVTDPYTELKASAMRSLQAATQRNANLEQSSTTCSDRPFGSQIKVNNKSFVMVDEPELGERLTQPECALCMVGSLEDSILFTPQAQPYQCLVQYFKCRDERMTTRVWMEEEACMMHCKAWLFKAQADGVIKPKPVLTQEEVDTWGSQQLWSFYDSTKKKVLKQRPGFESSS